MNPRNECNSVPSVEEANKSGRQHPLRYFLKKTFTGNCFYMRLQCHDGTFVHVYSDGSIYDDKKTTFIGTIINPTIFFSTERNRFVEVLYDGDIALEPIFPSLPPSPPQLQCVKSVPAQPEQQKQQKQPEQPEQQKQPEQPEQSAKYDEFNYSLGSFSCDTYTCPELHITTGQWKYSFYAGNGVCFTANGTMKQKGTYASMVYVYNGENLFLQSFQGRLKEAYDQFIKRQSSSF
jgi:hypothetical protein